MLAPPCQSGLTAVECGWQSRKREALVEYIEGGMEVLDVDSLPALVEQSLALTAAASENEWWFRGHGRSSFKLLPSLYRARGDVAEALELESMLLREFDNRSRTIREAAVARSPWEILFLM